MAGYYATDPFFVPQMSAYSETMLWRQKEKERENKKIRQLHVAEQLSGLAYDEYGQEILESMLETEVRTIILSHTLAFADIACLAQDNPRCRVHRLADGDTVVHAFVHC